MTDNEKLSYACHKGDIETIQILLDHGADVNIADNNGMTPLHVAAERECIKSIEKMLKAGPDLTIKTR